MAARQQFPIDVPITGIDKLSPKLSKIGQTLGKIGGIAKRGGRALTLGVTAPLVALGVSSISAAATFETAMNRVAALSGETEGALSRLEKQALELGSTTEFSANQAADGMGNLAQAGKNANQIGLMIPEVLQLASAAQLDLADAASITAKVLAGYEFGAERAGYVTDVLAEAARSGLTDVYELGEAMGQAGTVASAFGQEFTTTVAVLDKFADLNFAGEKGGNALKNALTNIAVAAAKGHPVLKRLGVTQRDLFKADGSMIDFLDMVDLLRARGITTTEALVLFQKRAGPVMVKMLTSGTDAARELAGALGGSSDGLGTALEMQQIMMRGAAGDLARFRSSWEGLQITIAKSGLLDLFKEAVQSLTSLIDRLRAADPRTMRLAIAAGALAAALGPLLLIFGSMATGLAAVLELGVLTAPMLIGLGGIVTGTLIPAVGALGAAFVAFLLSPLGLIAVAIGAVIGLGVALWQNWDTVSEKAAAVWTAIKWAFGKAIDFIWQKIEVFMTLPKWLINLFSSDDSSDHSLASGAIRGHDVDAARVRSAAIGGAGAGRAGAGSAEVGGRVSVDFSNLPEGARVTTTQAGDVPIDVSTGLNLAGVSA